MRALRGKFLDQPAINLARPVKAESVAERAAFDGGDAGFFHRDKGEIGGGGGGKFLGRRGRASRRSCAPAVRKNRVQQPHAANEREDGDGQNDRRALERLEFHRAELNEKPEQLKAALV